ncbi:glycolate oxidase FAD binding subunit [Actinoplanes campanulatus]|uniref:Glycolate oxidase FAD binding subunit n=1 Tax=Actinoplanes campanulatus TaxID=113559 RepID=A0A7W5FFS6_9ACTN|nr:FAD-binding oxidoreductase [Actinoplanes campanulatus]MBB3096791.1 glycolate oxidase FAD binding subunit [Actinoplanes campanulatus]GGN31326.1 FAD-linked oxidase [Actinoplanes campanulatus]GID37337.1 FAD-linked oxidase [Actinoplanes campanulatus]
MSVLDDLAVKAGDDDVVCGVPARFVAAPASTEEAAALIAAARDLTVVIRGGGTKLQQGPPPRDLDLIIDTRRLAGVVEHAAGDLITVVRAGTPMAELHALPGQQLALDAPPTATAGGAVSANASGPRRLRYGTARDLLIGVTVVRPDGRIARAGGKVVKNVAGYDLGKLYTGAQGTLGLITECVFRLHPVPLATAFVRATAPPTAVARILAAQLAPSAVEINAGPGASPELAVLVEGTEEGVRDRAATLARLLDGEVTDLPPSWWDTPPWPPGGLGLKLTGVLSAVPALVEAVTAAGGTIRGSAATGALHAGFPSGAPTGTPGLVDGLRAAATRAEGHAVVLTAPDGALDGLDMWGPVPGLELMRRVKDQFDPDHRFAPGRFVGGI